MTNSLGEFVWFGDLGVEALEEREIRIVLGCVVLCWCAGLGAWDLGFGIALFHPITYGVSYVVIRHGPRQIRNSWNIDLIEHVYNASTVIRMHLS
ncbi:hypothetical protein BO78DRAFT_238577 [Aspergillus sclerotiicarbonarius CBS 121057]|uniref:Uncharacterized protein n=1 Tax=Aspergillus sclerotiicarbonarius (strain CBS 121057 / IBT 28362) TaxID=1448318 RepID=A0A319EDM0_ASPSB|nr:hypothetical protein BO78DRAFT_238577 [Aspergillus sclerotiicarbonarius CBS 121057]